MSLEPGTTFGHYTIGRLLGKGGMGEVYRARDTKLGRDVAVKVLPEELSRDKERAARFEREARLLAQLNHQNIATLYGLEEHNGQLFLVMEVVEGDTLAERIARGPIPVDEALSLLIQIAEGLDAAHAKGIIHRDLKPANVKITPEGQIKILDFGLAKAFFLERDVSAETSQSPTLTKGTALGVIMGTPGYMSPEQARGKPVDKRTDVWAFACCLYEVLTRKKAFDGETVTDVIAAVVNREPDFDALPVECPQNVRVLLTRCLRKNARERPKDIGDLGLALGDAGPGPGPVTEPRSASQQQVSGDGGRMPVWSPDGDELFYLDINPTERGQDRMMSVDVTSQPLGTPRELFRGTFVLGAITTYDVAPDGRFLMVERDESMQTADSARIILNWFDELERLAPVED